MIKLIIFDVGGVVLDYKQESYYKYISKKFGIGIEKVKRSFDKPISDMEVSKLSRREFEAVVKRNLGIDKDNDIEWEDYMMRTAKLNKEVAALIKRLSRNYRIALLTNVCRGRHSIAMKVFIKGLPIRGIFASCYLKLRKPDKRIYKYVLARMHVAPGEAVFVDDMIENVMGAKRAGIHPIQYTGYKDLLKKLSATGVNVGQN